MSEALSGPANDTIGHELRTGTTFGATDWLSLAAAPSFAVMALLTAVPGVGQMTMICGPASEPSWLSGMVPMYLLMSGFHSAPWLRLIANKLRRAN